MKKRISKAKLRAAKRPRRRRESLLIRTLREQLAFFKREYAFMKGKVERLELAAMQSTPAGRDYVARTEESARPPIESAPVNPAKLTFAKIRENWDDLTPEQQEEYEKNGGWKIEQPERTN